MFKSASKASLSFDAAILLEFYQNLAPSKKGMPSPISRVVDSDPNDYVETFPSPIAGVVHNDPIDGNDYMETRRSE